MNEIKMPEPGLYLAKVPGKNWGLYLHDCPDHYQKLYSAVYQHHQATEGKLGIFYQSDSASNREHTFNGDRMYRYYPRDDEFWKGYPNVDFDELFNFLFVEFWCGDYDLILEHSKQISEEIGLELKLEGWR